MSERRRSLSTPVAADTLPDASIAAQLDEARNRRKTIATSLVAHYQALQDKQWRVKLLDRRHAGNAAGLRTIDGTVSMTTHRFRLDDIVQYVYIGAYRWDPTTDKEHLRATIELKLIRRQHGVDIPAIEHANGEAGGKDAALRAWHHAHPGGQVIWYAEVAPADWGHFVERATTDGLKYFASSCDAAGRCNSASCPRCGAIAIAIASSQS